MSEHLKNRLTADVYEQAIAAAQAAVRAGEQELRVDGQVEVTIEYRVTATATIPFDSVGIAEFQALELRVDDAGIHLVPRDAIREEVDPAELIENGGTSFDIADEVNALTFKYDVEVVDYEVVDFDIESIELDNSSHEEVQAWNEAAALSQEV